MVCITKSLVLGANPADQMYETFRTTWQTATEDEKNDLRFLWSSIMTKADVMEWKRQGDQEFSLVMKRQIQGTNGILLGTTVIPPSVTVKLYEDKGWKVIEFPENQIYQQVYFAYTYVKKISINKGDVKITLSLLGGFTDEKKLDEVKNIVKQYMWK